MVLTERWPWHGLSECESGDAVAVSMLQACQSVMPQS